MSRFKMTTEDPFYDEDGVLVDEDADWEDTKESIDPLELGIEIEGFDPYDTVNS